MIRSELVARIAAQNPHLFVREVEAVVDAILDRVAQALVARLQRRRCGRRTGPRLAIIDTQSVKCIGVRGPRGYDGAKKLVGRKRVALVDAEGHILHVGRRAGQRAGSRHASGPR
jgi:hypothetical protein